jgi:hypothetical protein
MIRETTTLTPHQPHGPVASAIKWAFKRYILAQRALGDVVAQARTEAQAGTSETPSASPLVTAEPVAHDDMCVRWISTDATEQRTVEELGALSP